MYKVNVEIIFENGEVKRKTFDWWEEATAWVQRFADEGEGFPATVTMQIVR